jgi:hypothetical protein
MYDQPDPREGSFNTLEINRLLRRKQASIARKKIYRNLKDVSTQ